jgi:hypothetical protein
MIAIEIFIEKMRYSFSGTAGCMNVYRHGGRFFRLTGKKAAGIAAPCNNKSTAGL